MRSARAHLPKPRNTMCGAFIAMRLKLLEVGVVVRVRRRAAAEDAQLARAVVRQLVPRTRRDEHRVARAHARALAADLQLTGSLDDEVDLLRQAVVVALRRLVGLERRLGEALRVGVVQLA